MDPRRADGRPARVVIVGAGFAGLEAARALARAPVEVTVVDRRNHHLFQPLLYQVATAALNPADISAPIRAVLRRQENASVILGEVVAIDPARRLLRLDDGAELPWDALVVATGATHSYLGHDDWAPVAPGLKTVEDALEIRRRVLLAFERAEREPDEAARRALLTFAIVGAGPTGVELAGALAEIAARTLAADFRRIRPESARVVLVEAARRVLPAYSEKLSAAALRQLERLGVEVRLGTPVTAIDDAGLSLGHERLQARTVLWAAGVAASPLARALGAPLDRAGRVRVNADLSVPGRPEIFVAGDLAAVEAAPGVAVPGVAPAAVQEGRHAAWNALRRLRGEETVPFRYRDNGLMATIGRAAAVARIGRLELSGLVAWLAWLLVHIFFLIGFRNRVAVILQWAWSYLTFKRGARLITDTAERWRLEAERRRAALPAAGGAPRAQWARDDRERADEPDAGDRPPTLH